MIETLFRFFPPPVFLTMPHSGLSFSDEGLRIVTLSHNYKHTHLTRAIFEKLPEGVIENGIIKNADVLIETLKKVRSKYKLEFIAPCIPEQKSFILKTTIDRKKDIPLIDMVSLKIKENVPMDFSDAIFDYNVVKYKPDSADVVIRVVHSKVINAYLSVCKAALLKPLFFKIESQAIADAVIGPHDDGIYVVVNIDNNKTICSLVNNHFVELSTILDINNNSFIDAISKGLSVSREQARDVFYNKKSNQEEIFFSIANLVSVIRDGVMKYVDYWNHKGDKGKAVKGVIINGMPVLLDSFDHYLEQGVNLKVNIANVWENAFSFDHTVPSVPFVESIDFVTSVGLALPRELHF
jgi:Tfp pilus assembly PilM family ATPase